MEAPDSLSHGVKSHSLHYHLPSHVPLEDISPDIPGYEEAGPQDQTAQSGWTGAEAQPVEEVAESHVVNLHRPLPA